MTLLNPFLCLIRGLLMKTWWNWRSRERTDTRGGSKRRTEGICDTGNDKQTFFISGGSVSFEAQDLSVEQYRKVAAAIQNAIQCYRVTQDKEKRATGQTSRDCFFKRADRIESSKESEPVPSMSGGSETAARPPSPVADDPSALPSPTSPPSSSQ